MKLYILYQLFKLIKNITVWFLLNGSVRRIKIPCTLIQAIHQPRTELVGERNESLDRWLSGTNGEIVFQLLRYVDFDSR